MPVGVNVLMTHGMGVLTRGTCDTLGTIRSASYIFGFVLLLFAIFVAVLCAMLW